MSQTLVKKLKIERKDMVLLQLWKNRIHNFRRNISFFNSLISVLGTPVNIFIIIIIASITTKLTKETNNNLVLIISCALKKTDRSSNMPRLVQNSHGIVKELGLHLLGGYEASFSCVTSIVWASGIFIVNDPLLSPPTHEHILIWEFVFPTSMILVHFLKFLINHYSNYIIRTFFLQDFKLYNLNSITS